MRKLAAVATALCAVAAGLASPAAADTPGSATPPVPPVSVRVATYNIHAGAGSDNVYHLDRTAEAIRALDADVVAVQEVDVHWSGRSRWEDTLAGLGERLGMRTAYAPIYDLAPTTEGAPRRQYGLAILSRHPIVDVENHELTRLSTIEPNPVPRLMPGFLEATVQVGGARVHVYNTHLDYRGDPTLRRIEVAETLDIMATDGEDAQQLLLGDFNAQAADPELAGLWTRLRDAWTSAPVRSGEPGLTYPATNPVKRIDFVTATPDIEVVDVATQHDPTQIVASDHRAVVATVLLDQGSESIP